MVSNPKNDSDKMVTYGKWDKPLPEQGRFIIDINKPKAKKLKTAFALSLALGFVGGCEFYLGQPIKGVIKAGLFLLTCKFIMNPIVKEELILGIAFLVLLLLWYLISLVWIWRGKSGKFPVYDNNSNRLE